MDFVLKVDEHVMFIEERDEHSLKISGPSEVMVGGSVIEVKANIIKKDFYRVVVIEGWLKLNRCKRRASVKGTVTE